MVRHALSLLFLCFLFFSLNAQSLNWHLSAQAGAANYEFENFQGAFLTGFKTPEGQQLSVGPVFKGFTLNAKHQNILGGRIYSQAKMLGGLSLYMQCDVFARSKSSALTFASSTSTIRLETGAGIIYTYHDFIGLSAGYNLGEFNPISGVRKNTPAIKLIYLMPFGSRDY